MVHCFRYFVPLGTKCDDVAYLTAHFADSHKQNMQELDTYGFSERDTQTIFGIFKKYSEVKSVLLFGSRAKGIFHKGSDVDLAIDGGSVTPKTLRQIKSDFEESDLPYRVDLLDFNSLNNIPLKEHIKRVGKPIFQTQIIN
jgi:predicted nucleotidyltransferase